ncbi:hypothetical protein [Niallia sp. 03133]|uniref:hypothetical protein n=1 Tax=Niallia sp. 03133 TaxID=3458060 RepID=UPI004044F065
MKKLHETQKIEDNTSTDENRIFFPPDIEKLNDMGGGGIKHKNIKIDSLPKGIKYIGYFIFGTIILSIFLVVALNFLF